MYNIGQGTVTLLDHNEEYVVTFPSGFGRSILTVPWVELGGKVSINCPQTGYSANIEFKCKQFFSSDVNKVIRLMFLVIDEIYRHRVILRKSRLEIILLRTYIDEKNVSSKHGKPRDPFNEKIVSIR